MSTVRISLYSAHSAGEADTAAAFVFFVSRSWSSAGLECNCLLAGEFLVVARFLGLMSST